MKNNTTLKLGNLKNCYDSLMKNPNMGSFNLTRCEFPQLQDGNVTWGEFVLYAEKVVIALGDCGARIMYVDND